MKFLVIGLGSMGKRRIRLLKQIHPNYTIIGVDTSKERREFCALEWNILTYDSIEAACVEYKFDCALVCTSPTTHPEIINQCLKRGFHVFTELNLSSEMYDENIKLATEKNLVLFLSSTFIYREEMRYIYDLVKNSNEKMSYRYHIGQYLPDWHPWEDYRNYFVAYKKTNGCREILALELPWLIKTFGHIDNISVIRRKVTNLDIDYEDTYMILVEHECGHIGSLCVDVVSRKAVRLFELYNENIYLNWNGTPDTLTNYNFQTKKDEKIYLYEHIDSQNNYASFIIENAYKNEIIAFINAIENGNSCYDMSDDIYTLKYIDIIENIN